MDKNFAQKNFDSGKGWRRLRKLDKKPQWAKELEFYTWELFRAIWWVSFSSLGHWRKFFRQPLVSYTPNFLKWKTSGTAGEAIPQSKWIKNLSKSPPPGRKLKVLGFKRQTYMGRCFRYRDTTYELGDLFYF